MKKGIGIVMVLALVAMLIPSIALADDYNPDNPTGVVIDWGDGTGGPGSGWIGATFTAGDDANTYFQTGGLGISGHFEATDTNILPYAAYHVDSYNTNLKASAFGSFAMIEYYTNRTDSWVPMYGPAGQQSYNYLEVINGSGSMAMRSSTNYAEQKDCCYGWQNSNHFVANGDGYYMEKKATASDGDFAMVEAWGGTSACYAAGASGVLDSMGSEMYSGSVNLGKGCGCYTNADFVGTGGTTFQVYGQGDTEVCKDHFTASGTFTVFSTGSITTDATGIHSYGSSANLGVWATSPTGWNINNYCMTAK